MLKKIILILSVMLFTQYAQADNAMVKANDFTLESRGGNNIRLNELVGNVVLVNFWASWCAPCRKEMPKLELLYQKYKDLGVTILAINIDKNSELSKKILKQIPVNFTILYDPENNVSADYKIQSMPSTFLIDKNGLIRFRHNGYLAGYEDKYEKQIKLLLRE